MLIYKSLAVGGKLEIVGQARPVLCAGEAIDALLGDRRFAGWLKKQPRSTWSAANLFLANSPRAGGIVPAGPVWDIELFREIKVKRNWAIGFVDA